MLKAESVKATLRKWCLHLSEGLPSHFCLEKAFGNIWNRGQRDTTQMTMTEINFKPTNNYAEGVFLLVRGLPLTIQYGKVRCNLCLQRVALKWASWVILALKAHLLAGNSISDLQRTSEKKLSFPNTHKERKRL